MTRPRTSSRRYTQSGSKVRIRKDEAIVEGPQVPIVPVKSSRKGEEVPRITPPYPPEFRPEAIRMVVRVSDEERPIPKKLANQRPLPGRLLPVDALGSRCHEHAAVGMRRGGH